MAGSVRIFSGKFAHIVACEEALESGTTDARVLFSAVQSAYEAGFDVFDDAVVRSCLERLVSALISGLDEAKTVKES